MTVEERKSWLLLGVLFLSNFFVIGSSSSITGVFLTPLVKALRMDPDGGRLADHADCADRSVGGAHHRTVAGLARGAEGDGRGRGDYGIRAARGGAGQFFRRDGGGARHDGRRYGGVDDDSRSRW